MAEGVYQLDAWIERLKKLGGEKMPERVAELAAPLVHQEVIRTVNAGTDPQGKPWTPKKNGEKPLTNAAAAIKTVPRGRIVSIELTGPTVYHHKGIGNGKVRRQVLPDPGDMPAAVMKAVEKAIHLATQEILKK